MVAVAAFLVLLAPFFWVQGNDGIASTDPLLGRETAWVIESYLKSDQFSLTLPESEIRKGIERYCGDSDVGKSVHALIGSDWKMDFERNVEVVFLEIKGTRFEGWRISKSIYGFDRTRGVDPDSQRPDGTYIRRPEG